MPTDVDTFNMLRENVLDTMGKYQLETELMRVAKMEAAVAVYRAQVESLLDGLEK